VLGIIHYSKAGSVVSWNLVMYIKVTGVFPRISQLGLELERAALTDNIPDA
jgi:hypothetical protein